MLGLFHTEEQHMLLLSRVPQCIQLTAQSMQRLNCVQNWLNNPMTLESAVLQVSCWYKESSAQKSYAMRRCHVVKTQRCSLTMCTLCFPCYYIVCGHQGVLLVACTTRIASTSTLPIPLSASPGSVHPPYFPIQPHAILPPSPPPPPHPLSTRSISTYGNMQVGSSQEQL